MNLDFLKQKKKYKWKHRLKTIGVILLSPIIIVVGLVYVVIVLWPIVMYDFLKSVTLKERTPKCKRGVHLKEGSPDKTKF